MHELGLLREVVAAVEREAARAVVEAQAGAVAGAGLGAGRGAVRVEAVGLRVGTLSGAVPLALTGAWPIAIAGTALQGARLDIEEVQATVWCPACAGEQPVDQFYALTCPTCGTPSGLLVRGREFEVAYADLDIPGASHGATKYVTPDRA
ncbi:MAG: hydrogenase maturation nickel metallochaperone HypA [Bifidobacteriaceae bacterium]|nr:hydrogenase maturation nickel metallochaperone HypA [Bifidobacteriaceae bacterium]